ncbi:MAG: adenine-specific methyltransferase EcoRI family protein [Bacteroidales bacterium]|nr:adenine-specific methyltransferase EcoRI family protein [Bacteroidales bacterium]
MPNDTKALTKAKTGKKDEFYTRMEDICAELKHYKEHFKGKVVFCNCDDPYESNFFKYFALNFNALGLKKLICTCWNGSRISGTQLDLFGAETNKERIAYKIELSEIADVNNDGATDLDDVETILKNKPTILKGNGDFRSEECMELLEEADIVVTNPPFSLIREYLLLLIGYKKQFLIVGNINTLTCKEIFPLVRKGLLWIGPSITSGDRKFYVPDDYELDATGCGIDDDGRKFIRAKGVRWFTNLGHKKRHQPLDLHKKYKPEEYPKYDNYNAVNVDKVSDIPIDYDGIMGVPITFLDKWCPEQFEVLGITENHEDYREFFIPNRPNYHRAFIGDRKMYSRVLIRKKQKERTVSDALHN